MEAAQHNGITSLALEITRLANENTALHSEVERLEGMRLQLLDRLGQQDKQIDKLLDESGYSRDDG